MTLSVWKEAGGEKGWGDGVLFRAARLWRKSVISLTECWNHRGKSPWMAISGVARHGCRWLRPVRIETQK